MDVTYRIEQKRKLEGPFPGPKSQELAARRANAVAAGVASTLPVYAADVDGGIIVDVDGNQLIDLGSGIAVTTVGASNPAVAKAVAEQAQRFTHTCFMVAPYEGYIALAEKLAAITPGTFEKRAAFFNSGSEAVENAIKVARVATGRQAVVAFDHAYHGRTNLTMGLTAKAAPYKRGFGPLAPEIYRMPMSYPYREENPNISGKEAAERAILAMEKQIGGDQIAAIIIEPIQGEGGFIVPAAGFLPRIAEWAKENGIVFVADEVQAGFARSGAWFASDIEEIEPDIITVAKGIAGGMPLSGIVGRAELIDAVHGGGLGGTYGGNPVAVAAALESIKFMEDQDLPGRAREIEEQFFARFIALQKDVPALGEVRGRGAMIALEFVKAGGKQPDAALTKAIAEECLAQGVLILTCGTYGNVVRLLPPLVIGDELLTDAFDVLEAAIRKHAA
ncbi:4-aminobutyrate--2-oxoglutarate transaminase [Glutamicibacter protophormiae]|uniref:(S)-3-amino-2-methylpropionate transaminase n=1 Tax=Glutamicibacter protophormiae TaxID=37930 RepID=A0ABS4XV98_GLUPR|nr:4-aminobutyrate--2-oxoglutarate transaminase [Glutamicibacter protophormiae]MBP2400431.1 4-aminobutyrate aminotransferase/(S)-3-amino-2-methylpropionate transaminase [Glutamicibacter protophormiae]GGL94298.1 4-aminobutyrate aminotransferase GabT [Glutamicibacter protophormiae]